MSRFDSESLNAPHTQRHLDEIPQSAPTAEKMAEAALARAGLVKRLRQMDRGYHTILTTAADRIEQLEAELERRKSLIFAQSLRHTSALMRAIGNRQAERDQAHEDYMALMDELNAEKALADYALKILDNAVVHYGDLQNTAKGKESRDWQSMKIAALDIKQALELAHRKARGL